MSFDIDIVKTVRESAYALLGIVEFATGQRFFPFRLDGATFETDTRSAAREVLAWLDGEYRFEVVAPTS